MVTVSSDLQKIKNVVWDIDGCLFDFVGLWFETFRPGMAPVPASKWDFFTGYGVSPAEFGVQLGQMTDDMWDPRSRFWGYSDDRMEGLAMVAAGFDHYVVTARNAPASSLPPVWLLGDLIGSDDFKLRVDAGGGKAAAVIDLGCDPAETLVIEDSPSEIAGYKAAGFTHIFAPDHEYCRGLGTVDDPLALLCGSFMLQKPPDASVAPVGPLNAALRHNSGKPELHYLFTFGRGVEALARVFEQGGVKYEPYNYLKGGKPDVEYLDSALRHIGRLVEGERFDVDTGCHHAAMAAWNMLALIHLNHTDSPSVDPEFDQAEFVARWAGGVSDG